MSRTSRRLNLIRTAVSVSGVIFILVFLHLRLTGTTEPYITGVLCYFVPVTYRRLLSTSTWSNASSLPYPLLGKIR